MNDSDIVDLYWNKNELAIAESNKKYGNYCFTIANNILSNKEDSKECVNDTWFNAWKSIPPQKPIKLQMFLAKITRNISFNKYNANNAKKRGGKEINLVLDELAECIASETDVEDECITKELGKSICKFINNLPKKESNVFVRRYFFTESIKEISERYDLPNNNVMVMLSRTRKKLKNYLIREGYFNE